MLLRSAITDRGARLDIAVAGFLGGRLEKAFFYLRVFNPSAQSNRQSTLAAVYRRHKLEKREYEQRIREVERARFTPLVMSTSGGIELQLHSIKGSHPCCWFCLTKILHCRSEARDQMFPTQQRGAD